MKDLEQSGTNRQISARLIQARLSLGIGQNEAARRLGWLQSRIAKLENGTRRLLFSEAWLLADVYGISLTDLAPTGRTSQEGPWSRINSADAGSIESFMIAHDISVEWEPERVPAGNGREVEMQFPIFVHAHGRFSPGVGYRERDDLRAFTVTAQDVVVAEQRPTAEHWRLGGYDGIDPDAPTALEMHREARLLRRQMRRLLGPEAYHALVENVQVSGPHDHADRLITVRLT
jgi:transcriptional regulator with XRE-family HTH domain